MVWWPTKRNISPIGLTLDPRVRILLSEQGRDAPAWPSHMQPSIRRAGRHSGRLRSGGDVGMKRIASMWTIAIVLCLSGAAFADEPTPSGDAKSLGFSAARLARIAPWYQARFDSFSPPEGLVPGAVVAIARGGKLAYLQAIG